MNVCVLNQKTERGKEKSDSDRNKTKGSKNGRRNGQTEKNSLFKVFVSDSRFRVYIDIDTWVLVIQVPIPIIIIIILAS